MSKTFWMSLVTLLGVGLAAGPALAQGRGHDTDKGRDTDSRIERLDHDRDRDHDRDPFFARSDHGRPPGWSHGRKIGWGDCDVPPGQVKKQGCHTFARRSRRAVILRQPGTRPVVVSRPAGEVHAHAGVDAQVH